MHHGPLCRLAPLLLLLLIPVAGAAAPEPGPRAVVEGFHASLLAVMKEADALGTRGRYRRLAAPIEMAFNLRHTVRIAAGRFWRRASRKQKERLVEAFKRFSVSTYAAQFDGFSGEVFETVGERPGPRKTVLVETRIVRPGKDPVGLTYVVVRTPGGWRIVDVLLDNGISQLAVRRSEYRGRLRSAGIDGLIAGLNGKADSLLAE